MQVRREHRHRRNTGASWHLRKLQFCFCPRELQERGPCDCCNGCGQSAAAQPGCPSVPPQASMAHLKVKAVESMVWEMIIRLCTSHFLGAWKIISSEAKRSDWQGNGIGLNNQLQLASEKPAGFSWLKRRRELHGRLGHKLSPLGELSICNPVHPVSVQLPHAVLVSVPHPRVPSFASELRSASFAQLARSGSTSTKREGV